MASSGGPERMINRPPNSRKPAASEVRQSQRNRCLFEPVQLWCRFHLETMYTGKTASHICEAAASPK